jgi:RNA polymerase sigma-70 factor, ECF subfamily
MTFAALQVRRIILPANSPSLLFHGVRVMHQLLENSADATPPSLLQQAQNQDNAAWALLVEWARDAVWACCRQAALQDADRDEVCQEVFLRAWQNLSTFERRTSFRSWIRVIARNTIVELFRARKRSDDVLAQFIEQHPPAGTTGVPPDPSETNEVGRAAQLLVQKMKDRHWHEISFRAFFLTTMGNRTAAQVAEELGIDKAATVRQHKFRWLKRLRQDFATAFGDVLAPDASKRPGWPL